MGEQVRMKGANDELLFFLEPDNFSEIHNRMIKFNVSMQTKNVTEFLGSILKKGVNAVIENGYQYHGEFGINDLGGIKDYLKAPLSTRFYKPPNKLGIPLGYKFHQIGISLNDSPEKNKFGNVEIKFIKNDSVAAEGQNHDGMIVINLHLVEATYKYKNYPVYTSLRNDAFHKAVKEFFNKRAVKAFNLNDDDINKAVNSGFKSIGDSEDNLIEHQRLRSEAVLALTALNQKTTQPAI